MITFINSNKDTGEKYIITSSANECICVSFILLSPQVTGSAKTRHNRASLTLQYKALNTLGEILAYY